MIKLAIVAGEKTDKLATFMRERGTFEVSFQYNNLHDNLDKIQNQIVKVDKFLYVYQGENSIRQEMQVLRQLTQGSGFFTAKEFIMMGVKGEQTDIAFKFFNSVMQDSGKENYATKEIDGVLSYATIYDNLLGFTKIDNSVNKYKTLYRVERGSDVKKVFEGKDSFKMKVEPFSFKNVNNYRDQVALTQKTDAGVMINEPSVPEIQFSNPIFGSVKITDVVGKAKTILISGKAKSGKSIWASVLASSMSADGKSVLIFDYTETADILDVLKSNEQAVSEVRMLDMMRHNSSNSPITLCMPSSLSELKVKYQVLQNVFLQSLHDYDYVLIVTELYDLEDVKELLRSNVQQVVLCSTLIQKDVIALQRFNQMLRETVTNFVANDYEQKMTVGVSVASTDVKTILPFVDRVIKPIEFTQIPNNPDIYKILERKIVNA